jgi:uncharacterized protein (TIGR02118 family)
MIKVISGARRHPRLSGEDFRRAMCDDHAPLVARMPGVLSYVINLPFAGAQSAWDAVVELCFQDSAAFQGALASPEGQRSLAHMREIVDISSVQSGVFEVLADAASAHAR